MRKILVVAILVSLVGVGAHAETPEWNTISKFNVPKPKVVKDYRIAVSNDDMVVVFYDGTVHNAPDVERYAKLYEHVNQHFLNTERNAPVHLYIHSYKTFERMMNKQWPESAEQIRQGWVIFTAHTYVAKGDEPILVIETYQLPLDYTIIHELLHHYFNRVVRDGSLNQEALVNDYAYHLEALFRTTLETDF